MMFGNNHHAHKWGMNDKICFCLVCGQTETIEEEGKMSPLIAMVDCDPLWPDKDPDPEEDIDEGSQKKS